MSKYEPGMKIDVSVIVQKSGKNLFDMKCECGAAFTANASRVSQAHCHGWSLRCKTCADKRLTGFRAKRYNIVGKSPLKKYEPGSKVGSSEIVRKIGSALFEMRCSCGILFEASASKVSSCALNAFVLSCRGCTSERVAQVRRGISKTQYGAHTSRRAEVMPYKRGA